MKKSIIAAITCFLAITMYGQGRLVSVNPNTSEQGKTLAVTVTGSGTLWKTGSSTSITSIRLVQGSNVIYGSNINAITNTLCGAMFNIPSNAALGFYAVRVYQTNNPAIELGNKFRVIKGSGNTATLSSISPNKGSVGTNNLKVTITGSNTHLNSGNNYVALVKNSSPTSALYAHAFGASSTTMLEAYFNLGSNTVVGLYDVLIQNVVDGLLQIANGFTVEAAGNGGNGGNGGGSNPSSVAAINSIWEVKMFPSPADDKLNLEFGTKSASVVTITIHDLSGAEVLSSGRIETFTGVNNIELNISSIAPGSYFVAIQNEEHRWTKQLVIE